MVKKKYQCIIPATISCNQLNYHLNAEVTEAIMIAAKREGKTFNQWMLLALDEGITQKLKENNEP
jgi:predicted HicB family RNase H-like nuclease